MKLVAYIAQGARLKSIPQSRWTTPTPRPEGEIIRERAGGRIYSTIVRWRAGGGWQWRGIETNGVAVWYYAIEPGPDGNAVDGRKIKAAFEASPGYEYMVEAIIPLASDSPDRLVVPEGERSADIDKWRDKLSATSAAAALGAMRSERKAASSRENGRKAEEGAK